MGISINHWAVIIAALAAWGFGALWYSPVMFEKQWLKHVGKKQSELGNPGKAMAGMFLATLLMAYVLAHVIQYFGATTWQAGAAAGFWIWLGFVLTSTAGVYIFEGRPKNLYYIYNGYQLVALVIMGIIISIW